MNFPKLSKTGEAKKCTKYHFRLDVRGAIRNKSFSGFQHNDGRTMSKDEAFDALCELLKAGKDFIPVGNCDNFDERKGCLGHPTEHTL